MCFNWGINQGINSDLKSRRTEGYVHPSISTVLVIRKVHSKRFSISLFHSLHFLSHHYLRMHCSVRLDDWYCKLAVPTTYGIQNLTIPLCNPCTPTCLFRPFHACLTFASRSIPCCYAHFVGCIFCGGFWHGALRACFLFCFYNLDRRAYFMIVQNVDAVGTQSHTSAKDKL